MARTWEPDSAPVSQAAAVTGNSATRAETVVKVLAEPPAMRPCSRSQETMETAPSICHSPESATASMAGASLASSRLTSAKYWRRPSQLRGTSRSSITSASSSRSITSSYANVCSIARISSLQIEGKFHRAATNPSGSTPRQPWTPHRHTRPRRSAAERTDRRGTMALKLQPIRTSLVDHAIAPDSFAGLSRVLSRC